MKSLIAYSGLDWRKLSVIISSSLYEKERMVSRVKTWTRELELDKKGEKSKGSKFPCEFASRADKVNILYFFEKKGEIYEQSEGNQRNAFGDAVMTHTVTVLAGHYQIISNFAKDMAELISQKFRRFALSLIVWFLEGMKWKCIDRLIIKSKRSFLQKNINHEFSS